MSLKSFALMLCLATVAFAQSTSGSCNCDGMKTCMQGPKQTRQQCETTCVTTSAPSQVQGCLNKKIATISNLFNQPSQGLRRFARAGSNSGGHSGGHGNHIDLGQPYKDCTHACKGPTETAMQNCQTQYSCTKANMMSCWSNNAGNMRDQWKQAEQDYCTCVQNSGYTPVNGPVQCSSGSSGSGR